MPRENSTSPSAPGLELPDQGLVAELQEMIRKSQATRIENIDEERDYYTFDRKDSWSNTKRWLVGSAGLGLAAWAIMRRDVLGLGAGLVGMAMLLRSATDMPLRRLFVREQSAEDAPEVLIYREEISAETIGLS